MKSSKVNLKELDKNELKNTDGGFYLAAAGIVVGVAALAVPLTYYKDIQTLKMNVLHHHVLNY